MNLPSVKVRKGSVLRRRWSRSGTGRPCHTTQVRLRLFPLIGSPSASLLLMLKCFYASKASVYIFVNWCFSVCPHWTLTGTDRDSPNNIEKPSNRKPPVKKPRLPQNRNKSLDSSGTRLLWLFLMVSLLVYVRACMSACVCLPIVYTFEMSLHYKFQ